MHRLVKARFSIPEAGRGQHSDGAADHGCFVGKDITEHIGREDYVKLLWIAHKLHGAVVNVEIGKLHVGEFLFPNPGHRFAPQA